jgi:hypothetical protein
VAARGDRAPQSVDGFADVEAGALVVVELDAAVDDVSAAGLSVEPVSFLAALSPPFSDSIAFFRDAEG